MPIASPNGRHCCNGGTILSASLHFQINKGLRTKCSQIRAGNFPYIAFNARIASLKQQKSRTCSSAAAAINSPTSTETLQSFLSWLVANGVEGIGLSDSKIALFNGENGERGIAAVAPMKKGETFARVPLRLAITDDPDDEESNTIFKDSPVPWSVRLACKLLRQASNPDSPWSPYLAVLPTSVPSPLTNFTWEDIQSVCYEPARRQIDRTIYIASSTWLNLPEDAVDKTKITREQFEWALSLVHSRTFGTAGRKGGIGVRMLVPLVDMLNHAGDQEVSPHRSSAALEHVAADSLRWDIVTKLGGEPFMLLTTTREIQAGEELLLSYGERSNDDFFIHYGYIPPRNIHDDVILFRDIEEAIDWNLEKYIPLGVLTPQQLQAAITQAYTASMADEKPESEAEKAALESLPEEEAQQIREEKSAIKLLRKGRIDGRLANALEVLHGVARLAGGDVATNCQQHVAEAVAERAAEVLHSMFNTTGMRLESDLEDLVSGGDDEHEFAEAAAVYGKAIAENTKWTEKIYSSSSDGNADGENSSNNNALAMTYRAYKAMILWDALILSSSS